VRLLKYPPYIQMVDPIVICSLGPQGQMLANMLESPLVPGKPSYVVFDTDPRRVQAARLAGFPVIFGDGSRRAVLEAAGIERPRAFIVCTRNKQQVRCQRKTGKMLKLKPH
jgi:voltage-gated potassium channel Kch